MSHLFYNPQKPRLIDPRLSNPYDSPEYIFKGEVDSFLYKIWNQQPHRHEGMERFFVPDEQYFIKLNSWGGPHFIETHKDRTMPRQYIDKKYYATPGVEQPISYYRQFYTGGISFIYDDRNRLIEYINEGALKGRSLGSTRRQFLYNNAGNVYPNLKDFKFNFNDLGQLITLIAHQEYEKYFYKIMFEYDDEGRITKKIEYGYPSDEDEYGEEIKILDKGILLLATVEYQYTSIFENEIRCVAELNSWQRGDNNHLKAVVVFDKEGFKRHSEEYTLDGNLYATSYYKYVFDYNGNWVKAEVDTVFEPNGHQKDHFVYEREIQYK